MCGAALLGVAGKQFGGHTGGGRHLAAKLPQGVGLGHAVQLLLQLCGLLVCLLQLGLARFLCGIELLCLGFQIVVVGVFGAFPAQPVGDDGVHLGLGEGALRLLPLGSGGGGFLMYSFCHSGKFLSRLFRSRGVYLLQILQRGTVWRYRTSRFRFWRPALFQNELRRHEKSTVHFLHSALKKWATKNHGASASWLDY